MAYCQRQIDTTIKYVVYIAATNTLNIEPMEGQTIVQIVSELDRFIIGQSEAKKAVAIALRNRLRRKLVPEDIRDEVAPKNYTLYKDDIVIETGTFSAGSIITTNINDLSLGTYIYRLVVFDTSDNSASVTVTVTVHDTTTPIFTNIPAGAGGWRPLVYT